MQEGMDYVGDIFYEIELVDKFETEDEDIQTFTGLCAVATWVCC